MSLRSHSPFLRQLTPWLVNLILKNKTKLQFSLLAECHAFLRTLREPENMKNVCRFQCIFLLQKYTAVGQDSTVIRFSLLLFCPVLHPQYSVILWLEIGTFWSLSSNSPIPPLTPRLWKLQIRSLCLSLFFRFCLDSTYKWAHTVFIFLCLTHFT